MSFQFSPETLLNEIKIESARLEKQVKDTEALNLEIEKIRQQIQDNPPEWYACNCRTRFY